MDNVIDRLLQIKELREGKAQREVTRARSALDEAEESLDQARSQLEDHRTDCDLQERQIYADICTRQVRLIDLQHVALKVDEFKQSIQEREEGVEQARDRRASTADCFDQAVLVLQVAARVRQNFTELREVTHAETLLEQSRAEDAELEEVPVRPPAHDEEHAS